MGRFSRTSPCVWVAVITLAGAPVSAASQSPDHPASTVPAQPAAGTDETEQSGGRTATVVLQDGQVLTGELVTQSAEQVVLLINGVRTTIQTRRIRELYIQPPIEVRYKEFRRTIANDDVDGLIRLAEWLIEQGRPEMAVDDLELALAADPFAHRARELLVIAREAVRLSEQRTTVERPPETAAPEGAKPERDPNGQRSFPLISDDDVNIIRVFEVDLDRPPRMTLDRDDMKAALDDFAGQPGVPPTEAGREALLDAPVADQLALLFRLRAREHYGKVTVLGEPESLRLYRDNVFRTWLNNSCATARCHGGTEAGRLRLASASRTDPRVYLTNLLILEQYRTDDGSKLIDFDQPASSRLLQAGLPRHIAAVPHPEARGWKPVFRGTTDSRFRNAVRWIDSMYVPRPGYPVDYTPPTAMEPGDETPGPPR